MAKSQKTEVAPDIDEEVQAAELRVEEAKAVLQKAEEDYAAVLEQTDVDAPGAGPSIGAVFDGALDLVRRHPGLGVAAAAAAGFLLGRFIKRW